MIWPLSGAVKWMLIVIFAFGINSSKRRPRRIPDYPDIYWSWNFIASIGAYISGIGLLLFFILIILSMFEYFKIININSLYLLHVNGNKISFIKRAYNFSNIYTKFLNKFKLDNNFLWINENIKKYKLFFFNYFLKI